MGVAVRVHVTTDTRPRPRREQREQGESDKAIQDTGAGIDGRARRSGGGHEYCIRGFTQNLTRNRCGSKLDRSAEGTFELKSAGAIVTCTEGPMTGTQEANKPLGAIHMELKNCSTEHGSIKCTGLGDSAGVVLALGSWHLVFDSLTTLSAGFVILWEKVHLNCSALVLLLLTGERICLELKPTESNKTTQHIA